MDRNNQNLISMKKLLMLCIAALTFVGCSMQEKQGTELTLIDFSNKPLDLGAGIWDQHYITPNTIFVSYGLQPGHKIRIYATPYDNGNGWWQVKPYDGHWGTLLSTVYPETDGTANPDVTSLDKGYVEIDVDDDIADRLTSYIDWGAAIILQGEYAYVNKITLVGDSIKQPSEMALWVGKVNLASWEGLQDLAYGKFTWENVKPGSVLRVYCDRYVPSRDDSRISLRRADDWNYITSSIPEEFALKPSGNCIETTLTKEVIDQLVEHKGLIVMGVNATITKVSLIEPKK